MTLTDARRRAKEAVETAVGHVEVNELDGVLDAKEIARQAIEPPAVQVSTMGRGEDGIRLVAYVVTRTEIPSPPDALQLLDKVEESLRTLPGAGRAILDVRTQCLYDSQAMKAGSVALWAVTTTWPDLAAEVDRSAADGSLIAAANEFLAPAVDGALGLADVDETDAAAVAARDRRRGMTELDRRRLALDGPLPCAEVRHGDAPGLRGVRSVSGAGAIERRGSGTGAAREPGNARPGRPAGPVAEPGAAHWQQGARGRRVWPATVTFWAGTDAQADAALTEFLRLLPDRWRWSGQQNRIIAERVVGATYVPARGAHMCSVEVMLRAVSLVGERTQRRAVTVTPMPCPPGGGSANPLTDHVPPLQRRRHRRAS